jgi:hypothetical protein
MRKTSLLATVLSIVLLFGVLTPRAAAQSGNNNNGYGGYDYSYQPSGAYIRPSTYPYYQHQANSGYSHVPSIATGNYQTNHFQPNRYQPKVYQPNRYQPNVYQPYHYYGGHNYTR